MLAVELVRHTGKKHAVLTAELDRRLTIHKFSLDRVLDCDVSESIYNTDSLFAYLIFFAPLREIKKPFNLPNRDALPIGGDNRLGFAWICCL